MIAYTAVRQLTVMFVSASGRNAIAAYLHRRRQHREPAAQRPSRDTAHRTPATHPPGVAWSSPCPLHSHPRFAKRQFR
jgi:hypothetical protein